MAKKKDVPFGTGLLEKAKKSMQERTKRIDKVVEEVFGNKKKKKK